MTELDKIRWQCRRGSLELDLLLKDYLETRYPVASEEEKKWFIAMLKLDDLELIKRMNDYII